MKKRMETERAVERTCQSRRAGKPGQGALVLSRSAGIGELLRVHGRQVCLLSALLTAVIIVGLLAFTTNYGWLPDWFPEIPQIVITTFFNPGTVLLVIFMGWSFDVTKRTNSTRMGALAIFTWVHQKEWRMMQNHRKHIVSPR